MRTKFGEITIGKIIIALLLIFIGTLMLSTGNIDEPSDMLNLPIKDYFIGFFLYIVCWITGLLMNLWDYLKTKNLPGLRADPSFDKEILKLKEKGYFTYRGWMEPKENECRHLNSRYVVTEIDRIFYTYGPPFGEPWEFDSGVVYWFGMIPMMGMIIWAVWVGLPLIVIFGIYNFFF
jgi:hypothetical protein